MTPQPGTDTSDTEADGIPVVEDPGTLYDGAAVSRIVKARLAAEKRKHAKQLREAVLETARILKGQTNGR